MSIRAIWVLSLYKDDYGDVLFYRHFPTVEKRCRKMSRMPPAVSFANNLLVTLGLKDVKQFVEWRDKCDSLMQLPVIELSTNGQTLWPVISVAQNNFLACCLPFDERNENEEKSINVPHISLGFSLLLGILNVIGATSKVERLMRIMDLDNYLSLCMPFGTPSEMDLSCVGSSLKSPHQKLIKKQPAWKPSDYRGKQVICIKILEFIRCVLAHNDVHFQTFGQVSVRAEVEGGNTDVSLTLSSVDLQQPISLHSLALHPCVTLSGTSLGVQKRLRFSPPLHEFVLFHYVSSLPKDPPLQGTFKMIGEGSVELLLHLKLNERVKNAFDFCDLVIMFFNKGPVEKIDSNVSHGMLKLSDDRYSLRWTIGSKFPKDLEVKLTAKVYFSDGPILTNSDPFCIEKNCYTQIHFKQSNATLSGLNVDPKSVTLSEGGKPKILLERRVQSTEYRIWNSYGDLPFPLQADRLFHEICS